MVLEKINNIKNESIGQIFTPGSIAEFMVANIIIFIKKSGKEISNLEILEPSVGRGVFIKFLQQFGFIKIIAYEIDKLLKKYLIQKYPNIQFRFSNVLGSDLNEKFDIIIGNPPYLGQNYNAEIFQKYCKNFSFCKKYFVGNMDLFYYFIHLGIEKLKPGGFLTFITTNYWITKSKKTGIKYLKPHIIDECFLLQYIDLSHLKLFKNAEGQHNCIFVLQKKTEQEKLNKTDKSIEVIQISNNGYAKSIETISNNTIFSLLVSNLESEYILKYTSSLTNNKLPKQGNWNLLYPKEVKEVIDKIEKNCIENEQILYLQDFFIIRNGIIFIKDEIFILTEKNNIKVKNGDYFLKINNHLLKLNHNEINRLKKIYKSKSIRAYGYNSLDYEGYAIYLNKNEFQSYDSIQRNKLIEAKYPSIIQYLKSSEDDLRKILINAKENPNDLYFPRRGTFIRKKGDQKEENLIDLEPLYETSKKIFIKYISNNNLFGYCENAYYATSDTYFLWPKLPVDSIDYPFMLAYLNSKLVYFIFKAKNIKIKRSKTKLEEELPILNLKRFTTKEDCSIISLIRYLSNVLILYNTDNNKDLKFLKEEIKNVIHINYLGKQNSFQKIYDVIQKKDQNYLKKFIDKLFFQLLDIKEKKIDELIERFYLD